MTDADARSDYERSIGRYGTPERRQLEQIVFPTEEEARAASARLARRDSFEALAKERGLNEKDIDLGVVTKAGIIDRAVADAAFALKEGEISAPIKGLFGTTLIVQVVKIEPEQVKTFEEVAPEIKQRDRDRPRQGARSPTRYDKIEDERAAGLRLTEIAQKLGLTPHTIEAVDRTGRDPDGKPVRLPAGVNALSSAFTSDIGVDNDPLQAPGRRLSSGTRCSASRRARPPARRGQGQGRGSAGATTRSPSGCRPRRPRWSTSSRPARRSPTWRPPRA